MKINQGSFGLTPEMKEQVANYHERKVKVESENDDSDGFAPPPPVEDSFDLRQDDAEEGGKKEAKSTLGLVSDLVANPLENLKKIGVELTDDDFTKIIFRGYLEKDITVVPAIRGSRALVATFRTLTGKEVDETDELLAEEINDVKMTNDGYQTRRNMWILSYGVSHLMGKPVCDPVEKGGKVNLKATARGRRKVLAALNPGILTKMMHIHGVLTVSINAIIADPEADYLKKS